MIEPFLCRVSTSGVPHTVSHIHSTEYTISGILPTDMCKLYWTLSSINIQYVFSINDVSVSRNIFSQVEVSPKNRFIAPVEFYTTGYDAGFDTSFLCRLNFDTVYLLDDSSLGLRFLFNEVDSTGAINFNLSSIVGMSYISYDFMFLNTPATVYLNYNPSVVSSARIDSFIMNLSFFS